MNESRLKEIEATIESGRHTGNTIFELTQEIRSLQEKIKEQIVLIVRADQSIAIQLNEKVELQSQLSSLKKEYNLIVNTQDYWKHESQRLQVRC